MRRVAAVVGILLVLFFAMVAALLVRTWLAAASPDPVPREEIAFDQEAAVTHLSQALRFPTISHRDPERFGRQPFLDLQSWLSKTYPRFHSATTRQEYGLSLLYRWPGTDPDLAPVLLMAHQDVVPIEPGTEQDWTQPPFSGAVTDGHVWGRGALDMKSVLVGILEAAEALLAKGFTPRRSVWFAFGHDEEVGGPGNQAIAEQLTKDNVRFHWVLDEGLVVTDGIVPGSTRPIALVGVAEKGYVTLELAVATDGGHASMPPASTAVGTLARAIHRIEANPFPSRLDGPAAAMIRAMAPAMGFGRRVVFSNLWLTGPLVRAGLERTPSTNAALRTTTATTMIRGGEVENVLPQEATAVVNVRIHPRDSIQRVTERLARVVDDPDVKVRPREGSPSADPSPVSPTDAPGYRAIQNAIQAAVPDAVVAPGLFVAGSDSRHYVPLADAVYRFMPARLGPADPARIHGTDERISAANFLEYVRFYARVMREGGSQGAQP